ncbi:unnamed protein product [Lepeophtheirus salmonis]|uniref:(salmon louse) hypothetical protein n=1 Tax=Lepeophtheirus salmonis TaxID=72036 RepID=A0A7R8CL17_LEPSM|nr:unnamed protein product [Lepeophtheirus salmonis]CAF2809393.1 unnamed protein product [Lepeophtheirus salmonis]
MSNKLYIASFICLLLSMTLRESFSWSEYERGKQMDQMDRFHGLKGYSEEGRIKRGKRSADGFPEEMRGMNDLRSNMRKRAGLTDQYCAQPCSFTTFLIFC